MPIVPDTSLRIDTSRAGEVVVVTLAGSADIDQAGRLRTRLLEAARSASRLLVLDLGELTFVCSTALGAMVQAHVTVRQGGGKVRLVQPTGPVLGVLEMTRLTTLMPTFATVAEAVDLP